MESLTQILEEELENSFEVKDRKALHRSVILLVENLVGRERHQTELHTLHDDMAALKDELKGDMAVLKDELKGDMADLKGGVAGLHSEISGLRETMQQGFSDGKHSQRLVISFLSIIFIVFGVLMTVYEFIR